MPDKVTFADRLKEALSIRGIKQIELSRMIGIPKSAISQYCSGRVIPKQLWTSAIAIALNVSESWLMGYNVPIERDYKENPRTEDRLGGLMDALEKIGALNADGSLSDRGRDVVTSMLRNNADMLKKFIDYED